MAAERWKVDTHTAIKGSILGRHISLHCSLVPSGAPRRGINSGRTDEHALLPDANEHRSAAQRKEAAGGWRNSGLLLEVGREPWGEGKV